MEQKIEEAGVVPTFIRRVSSSTFSSHYASISEAELKVHVSLNVGHQRGFKVVTSGTSVKIYIFSANVFTIFIH